MLKITFLQSVTTVVQSVEISLYSVENLTVQSVEELEKEMMHGQSFQGPPVAKELYQLLERSNAHDR